MQKIFSLTIVLLFIAILFPSQVSAGPCCGADKPALHFGKCVLPWVKYCLTGLCDTAYLDANNIWHPPIPTDFVAREEFGKAQPYACAPRDPANPYANPGEACDEYLNQCKALPVIAQTTACTDGTPGCVNSGLGPIKFEYGGFLNQIITIGISIGSGIGFLMLIYGSWKTMMSKGNPDAINEGKEIITSAVAGLVFIVFSVTIMQVIGLDILGLNRFGF
jgi:hypothetical protein